MFKGQLRTQTSVVYRDPPTPCHQTEVQFAPGPLGAPWLLIPLRVMFSRCLRLVPGAGRRCDRLSLFGTDATTAATLGDGCLRRLRLRTPPRRQLSVALVSALARALYRALASLPTLTGGFLAQTVVETAQLAASHRGHSDNRQRRQGTRHEQIQ